MKYLKKFKNASEKIAFMLSDDYATPNVYYTDGIIEYNFKKYNAGVYIQHNDGSLYTEEEWVDKGFANDEANGVAVLDSRASFVVARANLTSGTWSSDTKNLVSDLPALPQKDAVKDYDGYTNTQLILASGDTSGAAYKCANYTFNNGKKGYLPSLGEALILLEYNLAFNTALKAIGSTAYPFATNTWTSTQASATNAHFIWGNDKASGYKYQDYIARAFTTL